MSDLTNLANNTEKSLDLSSIDSLVKSTIIEDLPFELLDQNIQQLEQLIFDFDDHDQQECNNYFESLDSNTIKRINDSYCRWETIHESHFAEALLRDEAKVEDYLLYDRFKDLVKNELELMEEHPFGTVLFIGSGPFPITAIFLHMYTGKVIDCLEIDQGAANISNSILAKIGLQDKIRMHVGNGCSYDLSQYDVILNALLAKPKVGILQNIRKTNKNARLLCRTSYGLRKLVYEPTPVNVTMGFIQLGTQIANKGFTISTLFLINKTIVTDKLTFKWLPTINDAEIEKLSDMMNDIIKNDNNNGFLSLMGADHPYMKVLKNDVDFGTKHLLVIENNGEYLGQFILDHSYIETYKHRAEVSTLMINPAIRGKEVSIKIIDHLFAKCDELGIKHLTLTVRSGSKVELLWKHLGFETFGELPCYSSVGDKHYKGVYMHKDIESLKKNLHRKMENMYAFN